MWFNLLLIIDGHFPNLKDTIYSSKYDDHHLEIEGPISYKFNGIEANSCLIDPMFQYGEENFVCVGRIIILPKYLKV